MNLTDKLNNYLKENKYVSYTKDNKLNIWEYSIC
jgi:hypothetical protein